MATAERYKNKPCRRLLAALNHGASGWMLRRMELVKVGTYAAVAAYLRSFVEK